MDNPQDKKKKDLTNQSNIGSEQGTGQRSFTGGTQGGSQGSNLGGQGGQQNRGTQGGSQGQGNVGSGGQNVQDRERSGINKQQGGFGKAEETEEE